MPDPQRPPRPPRPPRPSLIDEWNKSIAIPGPVGGGGQHSKQPASTARPTTSPGGKSDDEAKETATKIALSMAKATAKATMKFAILHPNLMRKYALPVALQTLSKPLLCLLPLGPLGPILAYVAVATGRFRLRKEFMGVGYAALHALGLADIRGQALSLLGLVTLEATGTKALLELRDTLVSSLVESNITIRTQIVGLAIAGVSTTTGVLGPLGLMLGARSMNMLYKELRAFVTFHGLKWAASNLKQLWLTFCASNDVLKALFLRHVLRGEDGQNGEDDDHTPLRWVRRTLRKVAARMPEIPIEAVAPQLAMILKAWDHDKDHDKDHPEALHEWVELDAEDEESWANISRNMQEDMAGPSSQMKPGWYDEPTAAAPRRMGPDERRAPWTMEIEELDDIAEENQDEDDSFVIEELDFEPEEDKNKDTGSMI